MRATTYLSLRLIWSTKCALCKHRVSLSQVNVSTALKERKPKIAVQTQTVSRGLIRASGIPDFQSVSTSLKQAVVLWHLFLNSQATSLIAPVTSLRRAANKMSFTRALLSPGNWNAKPTASQETLFTLSQALWNLIAEASTWCPLCQFQLSFWNVSLFLSSCALLKAGRSEIMSQRVICTALPWYFSPSNWSSWFLFSFGSVAMPRLTATTKRFWPARPSYQTLTDVATTTWPLTPR
jgi:hypothetical protein